MRYLMQRLKVFYLREKWITVTWCQTIKHFQVTITASALEGKLRFGSKQVIKYKLYDEPIWRGDLPQTNAIPPVPMICISKTKCTILTGNTAAATVCNQYDICKTNLLGQFLSQDICYCWKIIFICSLLLNYLLIIYSFTYSLTERLY